MYVSCAELDNISPNPVARGQGNPAPPTAISAAGAEQVVRIKRIVKNEVDIQIYLFFFCYLFLSIYIY